MISAIRNAALGAIFTTLASVTSAHATASLLKLSNPPGSVTLIQSGNAAPASKGKVPAWMEALDNALQPIANILEPVSKAVFSPLKALADGFKELTGTAISAEEEQARAARSRP